MILSDVTATSLAVAVIENLHGFNRHLCLSPVTESRQMGGFLRWRTPVNHAWYNGVICTEPPGADATETVRSITEYFKAHGIAAFAWWPAPGTRGEDWAPHLLPQGYGFNERIPGMARSLDDLPAWEPSQPGHAPLEIRLASDRETLRLWAETFATGYEMPESFAIPLSELHEGLHDADSPMRSYLGFRGGVPVATSTLFLGAGVAGIYDVAILPSERGKGYGSAITLAPLREAIGLGYRIGILQSSPKGLPVYERLGFRKVCAVNHFFWRADRSLEPPAV